MTEALLQLKQLTKHFPVNRGVLRKTAGVSRAVDGVDLHVNANETLGLVGESGCGKSTIGKLIVSLYDATEGEIFFQGRNLRGFDAATWSDFRRNIQMIFQDPYSSLDPRMRVGRSIAEPLLHFRLARGADLERRVHELLAVVGLHSSFARRFPHELSGGQRQRVCIARAISTRPKLVICDEPVSALDVSIQAQVLNLLQDLQVEFGLAYLFISHNLSVVKHIAHRVAVMYLGKIVEVSEKKVLFATPLHPYTQALLSAIPIPDPRFRPQRILLQGDLPSPLAQISGCKFRTRCPVAVDACSRHEPELRTIGSHHSVACHLVEALPLKDPGGVGTRGSGTL